MTEKEILKEIQNLIQRNNLGRDDDEETIESINKILIENGLNTYKFNHETKKYQ